MSLYERVDNDLYDDDYKLTVSDYGDIELELKDRTSGVEGEASHCYTPEQAEKMAKRLKKAARLARAVL